MRSCGVFLFTVTFVMLAGFPLLGEPTELREWEATSGHKLNGRALAVENNQVQFEGVDGKTTTVAMERLSASDQRFLKDHFGKEGEGVGRSQVEDSQSLNQVEEILLGLLDSLGASDFDERARAQNSLLALSEDYLNDVVLFLWSKKVEAEPELRFRRKELLYQVFQRSVLGVGRPSTGIEWGRYLYFDKKNLPAAHPLIEVLEDGSIAQKSGLKKGDVVLSVDGEKLPVGDPLPSLNVKLSSLTSGEEVELEVRQYKMDEKYSRRGEEGRKSKRTVKLMVGEPENQPLREEEEGEFEKWQKTLFSRLRLKP